MIAFKFCRKQSQSDCRKNRRGAAVVEFAVVLPFALLILFGIVEMGRVFTVYQIVTSAAREGARAACLPGATFNSVEASVTRKMAVAGMGDSAFTFEINPSLADATINTQIAVSVAIAYLDIAWAPGFIPGFNDVTIRNTVSMRKEGI